MTAADPLAGLRFLVGSWRGEGTVRGRPATSRSRCAEGPPGVLSLAVRASRDGAEFHAETVVFRAAPGGRVSCTTEPPGSPGPRQEWRVTPVRGEPALLLTHPGFAWTIRREGPDAWGETFDSVSDDGRTARIVALRHVRDEDPVR